MIGHCHFPFTKFVKTLQLWENDKEYYSIFILFYIKKGKFLLTISK